jgi:tetratricopeptide (TPR) repeat protein
MILSVTFARLYLLGSICFAAVPAAVFFSAPVPAEADDQALCASDDAADDRRVAACTAIIASGKLAGKELAAAYVGRAYALEGEQEFERALADISQAIVLDPASAESFFRRGDIYKNLHQPEPAIEDFDTAIRLDPKVPVYFVNRSNAYLDKHDYDRALADIDEALRLDPSDPGEAIVNRCTVLAYKGDLDAAMADCQRDLQQRPNSAYAIGGVGFVYYKMGKFDEAIASYTGALKASDLDPYFKAYFLYGRGLAKLKKGDNTAEADFSEAKALWKAIAHDFE